MGGFKHIEVIITVIEVETQKIISEKRDLSFQEDIPLEKISLKIADTVSELG